MTMEQLYTASRERGTNTATYLKGFPMTERDRDLTAREVAELTSQSPAMIARLLRAGYFPGSYKSGTGRGNAPWRIPYAAVQHYRETMAARSNIGKRSA